MSSVSLLILHVLLQLNSVTPKEPFAVQQLATYTLGYDI